MNRPRPSSRSRFRVAVIGQVLVIVGLPSLASAQLWEDVTDSTIGLTAQWSNKVELADLNGDGRPDIIFANGGNYSEAGSPEQNRVFFNQGPGQPFKEVTTEVLGDVGDLARVVKARDLNGDGHTDILVGTTYQTQSRLYFGDGSGGFTEVTGTHLPNFPASIGDLEVGDVDGDGDIDIVLADWGPGDPFVSTGGRIRLWLNDGSGVFTDASAQIEDTMVQWSWDIELLDTDNDYDLDIVASCKVCTGSHLFINDGQGSFRDDRLRMPQFTNNYEFEPIDINGDGFWDLITINDGDELSNQFDRREHIFLGDGQGGFRFDQEAQDVWPDAANIGADDNAVVVLDFDSDGDPDFLIAALGDAADRLLINNGGRLVLDENVFAGPATPGTLGIAVADLNGDGKLDVVQSQGELATPERVYFGTGIDVDSAAPIIQMVRAVGSADGLLVRARVHDNKTPVLDFDFAEVSAELSFADGRTDRQALTWYGGALWRFEGDPEGVTSVRVCATDAVANARCSDPVDVQDDGTCDRCDGGKNDNIGDVDRGGCSTTGGSAGWLAIGLVALLARRRQRKARFFGLFR